MKSANSINIVFPFMMWYQSAEFQVSALMGYGVLFVFAEDSVVFIAVSSWVNVIVFGLIVWTAVVGVACGVIAGESWFRGVRWVSPGEVINEPWSAFM